jgi:hypothetical protein
VAIKLDKTALVKNLVKRHKLTPHLERAIAGGDFEWSFDYRPKIGDDAFHPSGHCLPSAYELWQMTQNDEVELFSPGLYKTFMVGHFWHQYLQHICLEKLHFCEADSIERRGVRRWGDGPFHYASGSGDIAPCVIPGYGECVVDFKTMGTHDFKRNGMPEWCRYKYEAQANIYMDFFDQERALIVCILKDSPHDFKEFEFHRNDALIEAIYDKWELVSHWLDEGVIPTEEPEPELTFKGPVSG